MPSDEICTLPPSLATKKSDVDPKLEYLPYEVGYLTETIKQVAEKELNETEERKESSLKKLRKLIEEEKTLYVRNEDISLLAYLRGRKYDVERAFKMIQNTYKLRKKKKFYDSEDNSIVHDVFRQNFIGFLPYRTKQGSVILLCKLSKWDIEKVNEDLFMWVVTHCLIHSIEDPATQVLGYTAIVDISGVGVKYLKMLTIENILLLLHSTQSCFPGRYKAIHLVGMPKVFTVAWNMIYPFVCNTKLRRRIFVHGEDMKSLHKHIEPAILPEEYGGHLGPFDNSSWHASILAKNEWCLEQRLYGYRS